MAPALLSGLPLQIRSVGCHTVLRVLLRLRCFRLRLPHRIRRNRHQMTGNRTDRQGSDCFAPIHPAGHLCPRQSGEVRSFRQHNLQAVFRYRPQMRTGCIRAAFVSLPCFISLSKEGAGTIPSPFRVCYAVGYSNTIAHALYSGLYLSMCSTCRAICSEKRQNTELSSYPMNRVTWLITRLSRM